MQAGKSAKNHPSLLLVTHPRLLAHDTGPDHPESPARISAIVSRLQSGPLAEKITGQAAHMPPRSSLIAVHPEEYLLRFEEAALAGRSYFGHRDNQMCYDTWEAAHFAAGCGLTAIDMLEKNLAEHAFCLVRPPGHHAGSTYALGFCFFNNVVIASRYWRQLFGRQRIAVVDFDAHHGNGIQDAFETDPDGMYISIHEHPTFSFPGTGLSEENGSGPGRGTILNIPLTPGADDAAFLHHLDHDILPAIHRFRPEAMIIAAGFDAHRDDDMSSLMYSTGLFQHIGSSLATAARHHCPGRLLSILEGGYHLPSLAAGVESYCQGLLTESTEEKPCSSATT